MGTEDALLLLKAHSEHPVPFAVGFNMRVAPATRKFRSLLNEAQAQVVSFKSQHDRPAFHGRMGVGPGAGRRSARCARVPTCSIWLRYTLGSPVAAVCGSVQHLGISPDREPNAATLLVKPENGACGTLLLHDRRKSRFSCGS